MAAVLNISSATVTEDNGTVHEKVQIIVRSDVATIKTRRGVPITSKDGVLAVHRDGAKTTISFAGDLAWDVRRTRGSCCGGR